MLVRWVTLEEAARPRLGGDLFDFLTNFLGLPYMAFLEMVGSRRDRPHRTPGLLLRSAISLGDLRQLWHPTPSHLH